MLRSSSFSTSNSPVRRPGVPRQESVELCPPRSETTFERQVCAELVNIAAVPVGVT